MPDRDREYGAPSNAELAERMARLEEQAEGQTTALNRIENRLSTKLDEIEDSVEANADRSQRHAYIVDVSKWTAATLSGGGVLAFLLEMGILV